MSTQMLGICRSCKSCWLCPCHVNPDAWHLPCPNNTAVYKPLADYFRMMCPLDTKLFFKLHMLAQVFSTVDPCLSVSWSGKDGDHVKSGTKFGVVKGSARSILVAERIALNFMQRMSGIATATAAMTDRMQASTLVAICARKATINIIVT